MPKELLPDETSEDKPVFDRGDELPLPEEANLPADDEGNILPGNDPLDEDPNDNGAQEQFDPEDRRKRDELGQPEVD